MLKRFGLRTRLVGTVIGAFLCFFAIVVLAVHSTMSSDLRSTATGRVDAGVDAFATEIRHRQEQTQNIVAQLAAQPDVEQAVASKDRASLRTLAIGNQHTNGFSFLTFVDARGNVLVRANGLDSGTERSPMILRALSDGVASGMTVLDAPTLDGELLLDDAAPFPDAPAIAAAVPIKSNGRIVGAAFAGTMLIGSTPIVEDVSHFIGGATALAIGDRVYASSLQTKDGAPLVGVPLSTLANYVSSSQTLVGFDGKPVGSLWAGIPAAQVDSVIDHAMQTMVLWALVGLVVSASLASVVVDRVSRSLTAHSREVNASARELGVLVIGGEVSNDHVDQTRDKLVEIEALMERVVPASVSGDGDRLRELTTAAKGDVVVIDMLTSELSSRLRDAALRVAQLDHIARSLDDMVAGAKPSRN